MITEYYAPKARAEAGAIEAVVWSTVKDRFSPDTERWAILLEHPQTGKFGCILPEDWRDLGIGIPEVDIQNHEEMEAAGWFPVYEL